MWPRGEAIISLSTKRGESAPQRLRMIVYSEPKVRFQADVAANRIAERIGKLLREKARRSVGPAEVRSWENSLLYVRNVLDDDEIPDDAQVSITVKERLAPARPTELGRPERCGDG